MNEGPPSSISNTQIRQKSAVLQILSISVNTHSQFIATFHDPLTIPYGVKVCDLKRGRKIMLKIVAPTMHLFHTKGLYWCVDVCDMNDTNNFSNLYRISVYYFNSLSNNYCKYLSALKSCLFAYLYNSISTYLHTRYAGHHFIQFSSAVLPEL